MGAVSRDGLGKSKMHVLEALLRLRQAACHPGLLDKERAVRLIGQTVNLMLQHSRLKLMMAIHKSPTIKVKYHVNVKDG